MKLYIVAKCKVCGTEIKAELYPNEDKEVVRGFGFAHNWERGVHWRRYILVCKNGHKEMYFESLCEGLPSEYEIVEEADA